jgi:hypothetical protein
MTRNHCLCTGLGVGDIDERLLDSSVSRLMETRCCPGPACVGSSVRPVKHARADAGSRTFCRQCIPVFLSAFPSRIRCQSLRRNCMSDLPEFIPSLMLLIRDGMNFRNPSCSVLQPAFAGDVLVVNPPSGPQVPSNLQLVFCLTSASIIPPLPSHRPAPTAPWPLKASNLKSHDHQRE